MRVNFLCNSVNGGWEPTDTRLGGTENGIVEWSEELVNRGHEVIVFRNGHLERDYERNGVAYVARYKYEGDGDVCINVKSPEIEPKEPTVFYTNDVDADSQDLSKYGCVVHISNWAKDNIPINNPNVFVVPHGIDSETILPGPKVKKQCIYTSSPDRGLNTLLRAWLKVSEAYPDATLLVTYGGDGPDISGVEYLGDLSEEEMYELYRSSDIWCHPATGGELQCIAGLKAQAAGCIPVVIPTMALSETVKHGYFAKNLQTYTNQLLKALGSNNAHIRQKLSKEHYITIKESTDLLLEVVQFVVDGYSSRITTR